MFKKLGLIVNPIAGMGGKVGLKGSDGADIQRRAIEMGAAPEAHIRATDALSVIKDMKDSIEIFTSPDEMGESVARDTGFLPRVVGSIKSGETTSDDTLNAARQMESLGVDLLLFAGGDGTARDLFEAVGLRIPTLGIPAGVKIHSAVYAVTPRIAGTVARMFLKGQLLQLRDGEVMDIDEEAFRQGIVSANLYGYLRVPEERRYVQAAKSGGVQSETETIRGIATMISEEMDKQTLYLMGPGTTTAGIMEYMTLDNTLLGVDVVQNKKLVSKDSSEKELISIISDGAAKIIVSVIGGQGYILGRGNQQISSKIVRGVGKQNIEVVASSNKLVSLCGRPLLVDTGDENLNLSLSGYWKVITGYKEYAMYRVG